MLPAARLTDLTATGDVIVAPGCPTVLIGGMPASCMGDSVAGPVCTGAVAKGSMTVLVGGKPVATVTSTVVGVNTVTAVPLTTVVAAGCPTVLVRP